jgi:hypothetical protein
MIHGYALSQTGMRRYAGTDSAMRLEWLRPEAELAVRQE